MRVFSACLERTLLGFPTTVFAETSRESDVDGDDNDGDVFRESDGGGGVFRESDGDGGDAKRRNQKLFRSSGIGCETRSINFRMIFFLKFDTKD